MSALVDKKGNIITEWKTAAALGVLEGVQTVEINGEKANNLRWVWMHLTNKFDTLDTPTTPSNIALNLESVFDRSDSGDGLRKIRIIGLDVNGDQLHEDIVPTGQASYGTEIFSQVNEVMVTEAGVQGTNAGDLQVWIDTARVINLDGGRGRTNNGSYVVPRNHTLMITGAQYRIDTTTPGAYLQVKLSSVVNGLTAEIPVFYDKIKESDSTYIFSTPVSAAFDAGDKVSIQFRNNDGDRDVGLHATLFGYLIDNDSINRF